MNENIDGLISRFADDMKIAGVMNSKEYWSKNIEGYRSVGHLGRKLVDKMSS